MKLIKITFFLTLVLILSSCSSDKETRIRKDFTFDWKFNLGDVPAASQSDFDDSSWRTLNLPHDWSIESDFSVDFPATPGGGALPGGIGWYRKAFELDKSMEDKVVYIDFDGVYRNSEVWINGHYLGKRPWGYISFRYELTPYLNADGLNVLSVRVDNSLEPNSRWYSGSGIYRNVWLTAVNQVHVDLWGSYITTPKVTENHADVSVQTTVRNAGNDVQTVEVQQHLINMNQKTVATNSEKIEIQPNSSDTLEQLLHMNYPVLWNVENPYLYKMVTRLFVDGKQVDEYKTRVGIRFFEFDPEKGFSLNGKAMKINGVCMHHDLGALGAAVNKRALERQLEILKGMGVNGIRTSHNPPAPELLDLCDRMGFIVQNESFDMWRKGKSKYDYSHDFPEWYERDLSDFVKRDRNHPSIFMWSVGNEVQEQWHDTNRDTLSLQQANLLLNFKKEINLDDYADGKGGVNALLTAQLVNIVKSLDATRPVTAGCNETRDFNPLFQSGALDMIGFNYHEKDYEAVPKRFPGKPFIVTESVSSLQTRGNYVQPSDSIITAPVRWDIPYTDPTQMRSAYDHSHAPWGATHETGLLYVKKYPHVAGQYIWTGFDYLGEPTPFWWPSRSSYFGIVDLAGFPKDVYYLYQSEWTTGNVLHVFPHWNWSVGQTIDIWAYYNNADEVELFLNDKSLGKRSKEGNKMHVMWRVPYEPGTLKAVSRNAGKEVLTRTIRTAGEPSEIRLTADRTKLKADGKDLSFVTVELYDKDGNLCPLANQLVRFSVKGEGFIAGTDNGNQNDHVSLKKPERHLFFGKCLGIVQTTRESGKITLKVEVDGLGTQELVLRSN